MRTAQTESLKIITLPIYHGCCQCLSNILPINGEHWPGIRFLPKSFCSSGLTDWGLIYVLLAIYTLYQMAYFKVIKGLSNLNSYSKSICYSRFLQLPIFLIFWHYFMIPFSMLLIVVILIFLIRINRGDDCREQHLEKKKFLFDFHLAFISVDYQQLLPMQQLFLFISVGRDLGYQSRSGEF